MINDLHQSGSPVVLILDDYQLISNTAIHEGLAFFVDHLPPNVHLVIATRSDPPLPVARLRARGQLVEHVQLQKTSAIFRRRCTSATVIHTGCAQR